MPDPPSVTVLMAVHNGERHVRAAMDSMFAQTFGDYELLIIDDASTDATPALLASYDDPRLIVRRNHENLGLTRSLNRGLEESRGRYIARLDADDLAEPTRLERQFAYLERHREVTVLGTCTTEIDDQGRVVGALDLPPRPGYLRWVLTWQNVIYHSTVLMRRESIQSMGGYDESVRYAQDHDLWTRVLMAGGRVDVLPRRLGRYRRGRGQISQTRQVEQNRFSLAVRRRYVSWLLGQPVSDRRLEGMRALLAWRDLSEVDDLPGTLSLMHATRRRCLERATAAEGRLIHHAIRQALLHHAAMTLSQPDGTGNGEARRTARMLWRAAAQLGPGGIMDPRMWKRALDLTRRSIRTGGSLSRG